MLVRYRVLLEFLRTTNPAILWAQFERPKTHNQELRLSSLSPRVWDPKRRYERAHPQTNVSLVCLAISSCCKTVSRMISTIRSANMLKYAGAIDQKMAPILDNVPVCQIFDFEIPDALLLVPGSANDFVAQLDILVQFVLLCNVAKIVQYFRCRRVAVDRY